MHDAAHPRSDAASTRTGREREAGRGRRKQGDGSHRAPKPIGIEAMRALRKAIREGTYPTDADVIGGLVRMMRPPERSRRTR